MNKYKDPIKVKQGKKNRVSGRDFELRVRKDLEEKGWIVDKFGNNVEFYDGCGDNIIHQPIGTSTGFMTKCNSIEGFCINCKSKEKAKLIQAKNKWAGPNRPMMMGAGFPDFSCHKIYPETIEVKCKVMKMNNAKLGYFMDGVGTHKHLYAQTQNNKYYEVIGVEAKTGGYLSKEEREKCKWLLENKIFSKILVASKHKIKNRIHIEYKDFKNEKENKQNI